MRTEVIFRSAPHLRRGVVSEQPAHGRAGAARPPGGVYGREPPSARGVSVSEISPPTAHPAIGGSTALAGLLGNPVHHSLSPAMQNAALQELGLDWVYLALPTPTAELAGVLRALEAIGCRGLNVTIPHKQAVATLAAELTPLAERVGAVNTLVPRSQGGWLGTNTDVEGFSAPLRQISPVRQIGDDGGWRGREAVVLGCGGSARAVVAALVELGIGRIRLVGRQAASLEAFAADCGPWAAGLEPLLWPDDSVSEAADPLAQALAGADLLVNTTPVGMAAAGDAAAAARSPLQPRQREALTPACTVYDLIYTPRPTALLRDAAARGCRTIDGLEMLVQQGAAALRLWSGVATVPVEAMRAAALARLSS